MIACSSHSNHAIRFSFLISILYGKWGCGNNVRSRERVGLNSKTEPFFTLAFRVVPEVFVVFFGCFGDVVFGVDATFDRFVSKDRCVLTLVSLLDVSIFLFFTFEVVLDERFEVVFGVLVEDAFFRVVFVPGDVEASVFVLRDINHLWVNSGVVSSIILWDARIVNHLI